MNWLRRVSLVSLSLSLATSAALAGVTITSPANGTEASSPFRLYADASTCSAQPVTIMGFSLDSNPDTTMVGNNSISAQVTATPGVHTLHVKAWGDRGSSCVSDVNVTISRETPAVEALVTQALGSVGVSSPSNGASVTSPFAIIASAPTCSSQPVTTMGYSLDTSSNTAIIDANSVHASLTATNGKHVLHVKSWGKSDACDTDVSINVTSQASGGGGGSSANGVTVSTPAKGATVGSPFTLAATSSTCSSQAVGTMGYSLDSSSNTTVVNAEKIDMQVSAGSGTHTLHVKSWGVKGSSCDADVVVTVNGGSNPPSGGGGGSGGPYIPPYASSVSNLQTLSDWRAAHDTGGPGGSSGAMAIVGSPSRSGHARRLITKFWNNGDERYSATFGDDINASNFVYDAWVYIAAPSNRIANLELDLNQVMGNGQTVIYGFQCDGYAGRWDFAENKGSPTHSIAHWISTYAPCNPRSWSTYVWHHVQISYSRNYAGRVTYKAIWFDGKESAINATVPSAFALGWGPQMSINFQVDGTGSSGSSTVYVDNLTVYRW